MARYDGRALDELRAVKITPHFTSNPAGSVLIEVGYLSNPQEAPVLAGEDFHGNSAEAIGDAVIRFFERYPPGSGTGGSSERR